MGLNLTGTLGVLIHAANAQLFDLPSAIGRLRATTFHISPQLLEDRLGGYGGEK